MMDMGRPKSKHKDLPPRMIPRVYPSGAISYYYNAGPNDRRPLGSNLARAKLKWAELESSLSIAGTFRSVAEEWKKDELRKRGIYTQEQYESYLTELYLGFGHIPLDDINTAHVQQYLNKRSAKVKANREISLLSTIFNWARRLGMTQTANPVQGSLKNKEIGRKVYVRDDQFSEVHGKAVFWVQDAMDLSREAGQRPGDVVSWTRHNIIAGCLDFRQGKTGKHMRIEIEGELKNVLERILARSRAVSSIYLVADAKGQRVTVDKLQKHFVKARGAMTWQFRDIRKKTGSDAGDIKRAQELLGHASEATTAKFYRQMKGDKVKPLR